MDLQEKLYSHFTDLKELTTITIINNTCRGVLPFIKCCCIYEINIYEHKLSENKREITDCYMIIQ